MLHLFNRIYVEFDNKIELGFDRVVISEQYGNKMYEALDKVSYGELMSYGKTYEEVVTESFVGFISSLKDHSQRTGKRVIIYCDKTSYKKLVAQWFKVTMPNLTINEFKNIVDYTVYKERVTSNTQLSSVHSVDLNSLWEDLGELGTYWESAKKLSKDEKIAFKGLELNHSYEFLLSTYLSGDSSYKEELRSTILMFLRRWFKEMFTDNRQMVLMNITNHKFQEAMHIDPELVDITRLDPLAGIPGLEAYADDEIWERDQNQYGICNLEGLSEEKVKSLIDTIMHIFATYEGMETDRSSFDVAHWAMYTPQEKLTDSQFDEIVDYLVKMPFDTIAIPRFDFQNVNFPLIQYFLAQKFNGKDLSKYRLL
jgi:hypothetical protein